MIAGYAVWQTLTVSEVPYLCEQHNIDAVIIAPDLEDVDIVELQMGG